MKRAILALSALSSLAIAGGLPVALERASDVATVIASARRQVLVLAPSLRARAVADALRRALVEGGVKLLILCNADLVGERSSFVPMLSVLRARGHTVEVRVLREINRAVLVVDEARAVFGPLMAEPESFNLKPTRLVNDPSEAQGQARAFSAQWQRATRWMYTIQPPRFTNGGRK